MPLAPINGVEIYYEEHGKGYPLVFSHEFAGDYRSWTPQVRFFARRYRTIAYSARGYHPSSVPTDDGAYSEEHNIEDLYGLIRHLGIEQAHVVGLSMGGNVTLKLGLAHPEVCASLVVAGYHLVRGGMGTPHWTYSLDSQLEAVKSVGRESLLTEADAAVREQNQARAAALIQRYGELNLPERPVFDYRRT